jgi:hypothetical protein
MEPNRAVGCLDGMYSLTQDASVPRLTDSAMSRADGDSLEDVYRPCRPGLVRLAHLLTGSAAAAEDVVHDAFRFARSKSKVTERQSNATPAARADCQHERDTEPDTEPDTQLDTELDTEPDTQLDTQLDTRLDTRPDARPGRRLSADRR